MDVYNNRRMSRQLKDVTEPATYLEKVSPVRLITNYILVYG